MSASPQFHIPVSETVIRFQHNEICELRSLDSTLDVTMADIKRVVSICNEELIYSMLFRRRLQGRAYHTENARIFFGWSQEGWRRNEWFVFVIRNSQKHIIGAIDIKADTLDAAEIGYWASANSPGIMANTVIRLCTVAKTAGYQSLFALTLPENERSGRVLLRAGFARDSEVIREDTRYLKFSKVL